MTMTKLPVFFRYRWLWHILFWVVIYLGYSLTYGGYWGHYYEEFVINFTLLPVRILGTYILIYLLLPLILEKKQFIKFSMLVAIHAFLYGLLIWLTLYYANLFPSYADYSKYPVFYIPKIFNKIISNYGIPVLAATIVIFKKWYIDELNSKKLAQEKLEAELKFLKSQIHPHFLFNTLNNLYALTLIKSEKTPDVVLKLSGLLDYMLYNSNDEFVSLEKEIEILESYLELEKLRYDKRLDLKYHLEGNIKNKQIAPLILLPFLENSFKHGASNDRATPKVVINIRVAEEYLHLYVFNSTPAKNNQEKVSEGIGLKNVRRRLELIYPDAHQLDCIQKPKHFEVDLKIYWNRNKTNAVKTQ